MTIFCVVCGDVQRVVMVKEKRGRERRASERERDEARRVSSVAPPKCLSSFLGFRKDVPERERRPNERTSDFVLLLIIIRFLSRMLRTVISKMFSTTRIPRNGKKKFSFFAHRPSGNLVRPGVVDPVRARAFRSTFHHEHIFSRKKKPLSLRLLIYL